MSSILVVKSLCKHCYKDCADAYLLWFCIICSVFFFSLLPYSDSSFYRRSKSWRQGNFSRKLPKHYSTITSNFPSNGCSILTFSVVHIWLFILVWMAFLIYFFLTNFVFLYRERNAFCCWNNQPWFWWFSETFLWTRGNCYSSSSYVCSLGPCMGLYVLKKNSSIFGGDDEYAINCYSNLVFTYVSFVELKLLAMHTQQLMYLSTLHPSEG